MTLQKLLLKLSKNKTILVECFCSDGKIKITIKEWYNFNVLFEIELDLNKKIDTTIFSSFMV
jgi:hypothetical protein